MTDDEQAELAEIEETIRSDHRFYRERTGAEDPGDAVFTLMAAAGFLARRDWSPEDLSEACFAAGLISRMAVGPTEARALLKQAMENVLVMMPGGGPVGQA